MKQRRRNMVNELFKKLSELEQVEAIALGGSRSGEHFDENSDYDIYLYCNKKIPLEQRKLILSQYCTTMEIGNQFWEEEDNCVLNNGIDIDILYRNLDEFEEDLANVVEKCQARNGYTTCMWYNLCTCKIIYDRDGCLQKAKDRFSVPYPQTLRKNIIQRNWQLLHAYLPSYERQINKAVKRHDIISMNHRVTAFFESYFDLLFALNNQLHPGEKRLISLCKERCKILPHNFEENLKKLLDDLYITPSNTAKNLENIIAELEKIIEK